MTAENGPVIPAVFLLAGLALMAVGVPLLRRSVPPNRLYGLRVPATFADERVWYEANARSGRDLIVLGAVVAALAVAWGWVPGARDLLSMGLIAGVAAGGAVILAVVGWARANRLLRAGRRRVER